MTRIVERTVSNLCQHLSVKDWDVFLLDHDYERGLARDASLVPLRLPRPCPPCEAPRPPLPLLPDELLAWLGVSETHKKSCIYNMEWKLYCNSLQGFFNYISNFQSVNFFESMNSQSYFNESFSTHWLGVKTHKKQRLRLPWPVAVSGSKMAVLTILISTVNRRRTFKSRQNYSSCWYCLLSILFIILMLYWLGITRTMKINRREFHMYQLNGMFEKNSEKHWSRATDVRKI